MSNLLVVDDDPHIVRTIEIMLIDDGHQVTTASSGEDALEKLKTNPFDIALVDLQLPGIDGTDVLRVIRDNYPEIQTIIITAYGSIETAVEAMKQGAYDYLTKPFSPDQVRHRLQQIEQITNLQKEVAGLKRRMGTMPYHGKFVTQNPLTLQILEMTHNVASTEATVLINGESGTGKTLLAKLIHESSHRSSGPFVTVDCTSFQESLLESELFGHKKGAFTGAIADKIGKVETADGGTLFLDEVGEVPLHLQGKLLRFVEEKVFERVGDPAVRKVDTRIIAATNRELHEMVQEKAFREDLFYRLNVVDIMLPALRNRPEDILLLAREFLASFCKAHGKNITKWDDEVEHALLTYSWHGNVRELANALERSVLLCPGKILQKKHLPALLINKEENGYSTGAFLSLAELEERHIRNAAGLNLSQEETAKILGIDPSTLWRKSKKYNI
ncbi:MAG: sigma-54-dependent Fis family transcriptional regulator [Victivallales bacterium]|nr:sigma-54-dependent Fis family transcriptional regulator [Victivallales bacterium]